MHRKIPAHEGFHNNQYCCSVFHEGWRVWLMFWSRLSRPPTRWEGEIKAQASERSGYKSSHLRLEVNIKMCTSTKYGHQSSPFIVDDDCRLRPWSGCAVLRIEIKVWMPEITGWFLLWRNVFGVQCTVHIIRHVSRQKPRGVWGFWAGELTASTWSWN